MNLNEKIEKLVESKSYPELDKASSCYMKTLLENTQKEAESVLNEGTIASDVAQFTPILMPLVRRVFPTLVANEVLGVQPMSTPTAFIYALTNRYVGSTWKHRSPLDGKYGEVQGNNLVSLNYKGQILLVDDITPFLADEIGKDTIPQKETPAFGKNLNDKEYSLNAGTLKTYIKGDTGGAVAISTTYTPNGGTAITNEGFVVYVEQNKPGTLDKSGKVLVALKEETPFIRPGAVVNPDKATNTVGGNVIGVHTNEAAFAQILRDYTGYHVELVNGVVVVKDGFTTAQAEKLAEDMPEIGIEVSRKSIEAKSRALKARYSVEMYQDLKAQHGLVADEELMNLISYEIQAELDKTIIDFVNANATQVPNVAPYAAPTANSAIQPGAYNTAGAFPMFGRWDIERFRAEVTKIKKAANQIGIDTRRGSGNILLISPDVLTMLEEVGGFKAAELNTSNLSYDPTLTVAGTFDNKFKVIVDRFATTQYVTVIYKGADRRDAMGFFAPYVPLTFTKVTNYESGQPAIIAKTRYALETIPGVQTPLSNDRAKTYARSLSVDFSGTSLA